MNYKDFNDLVFLEHQSSEPETQLLILLHGYGSNEQDLFSFVPELPKNFTVLCPRGLYQTPMGGYSWYDIDFLNAEKFNNKEQADASKEKVNGFINWAIETYKPSREKVWLGGFSQGAILTYGITQVNASIAYGICMSGYWPMDLHKDLPKDKRNEDLEFFISHGTEDAVIPFDWAKQVENELKGRSIPYSFNAYPMGHGVNPQNFKDLLSWIEDRNS